MKSYPLYTRPLNSGSHTMFHLMLLNLCCILYIRFKDPEENVISLKFMEIVFLCYHRDQFIAQDKGDDQSRKELDAKYLWLDFEPLYPL